MRRSPLGEVTEDIWAPAFVALLLSFVTGGRLVSRFDRLVVAGVFVAVFVLDVLSMLFVEQEGNVLARVPERADLRRRSTPCSA